MLKTLLRYIFSDGGNPKKKPLGCYNFKNAKDMSEECVKFTRKLMGYMKTQEFEPENRVFLIVSLLEQDDYTSPLFLQGEALRSPELRKTQNSLEYRIIAKPELICMWIVEFWIGGVNILAYFYTLLSYIEELITKGQILQGIRMAEQDLNMPNKLEDEWKNPTRYMK